MVLVRERHWYQSSDLMVRGGTRWTAPDLSLGA
jgi:hypothetical protein